MISPSMLRRVFTTGVPAIALAYAIIATLGLTGVSSPDVTLQISIIVVSFVAVVIAQLVFFRELL